MENEEEQQLVRALPDASGASGSSEKPDRLVVGNLARRVATITQHDLEEREVIALLGVRLTTCQWSILRLLLAHPLVSDEELAELLGMERKSARSTRSTLHAPHAGVPVHWSEADSRAHPGLWETGH